MMGLLDINFSFSFRFNRLILHSSFEASDLFAASLVHTRRTGRLDLVYFADLKE